MHPFIALLTFLYEQEDDLALSMITLQPFALQGESSFCRPMGRILERTLSKTHRNEQQPISAHV